MAKRSISLTQLEGALPAENEILRLPAQDDRLRAATDLRAWRDCLPRVLIGGPSPQHTLGAADHQRQHTIPEINRMKIHKEKGCPSRATLIQYSEMRLLRPSWMS